jgi:hypothetical protein
LDTWPTTALLSSQSLHVNRAVLLGFLPVACSSLPYINRAEHGSRQGRVQSSDSRQRREILGLFQAQEEEGCGLSDRCSEGRRREVVVRGWRLLLPRRRWGWLRHGFLLAACCSAWRRFRVSAAVRRFSSPALSSVHFSSVFFMWLCEQFTYHLCVLLPAHGVPLSRAALCVSPPN